MLKLTIVTHFYNNHAAVLEQIENWRRIDANLLREIEFILVDDHSDEFIHIAKSNLNLRLFRVDTDINWNQPGARNLATLQARAPWAIFHDLDQFLDVAKMRQLLESFDLLDKNTLYYMKVKGGMPPDEKGVSQEFHINSFLVALERFRVIGMYDEDFCGHYGSDDLYLPHMWDTNGGLRTLLSSPAFFEKPRDRQTSGLDRDMSRNKNLLDAKISNWGKPLGWRSPRFLLRFDWREVPIQAA